MPNKTSPEGGVVLYISLLLYSKSTSRFSCRAAFAFHGAEHELLPLLLQLLRSDVGKKINVQRYIQILIL